MGNIGNQTGEGKKKRPWQSGCRGRQPARWVKLPREEGSGRGAGGGVIIPGEYHHLKVHRRTPRIATLPRRTFYHILLCWPIVCFSFLQERWSLRHAILSCFCSGDEDPSVQLLVEKEDLTITDAVAVPGRWGLGYPWCSCCRRGLAPGYLWCFCYHGDNELAIHDVTVVVRNEDLAIYEVFAWLSSILFVIKDAQDGLLFVKGCTIVHLKWSHIVFHTIPSNFIRVIALCWSLHTNDDYQVALYHGQIAILYKPYVVNYFI